MLIKFQKILEWAIIKVREIKNIKTGVKMEKGQKIAQMIIQKVERAEIEEVEELSETKRGESCFGSTGLFKK